MKKFFAAAVALMMLFALCVSAFAGTAIDALTDANAKEIATAVAQQLDQNTTATFAQQNYRDQFVEAAAAAITAANYDTAEKRNAAIDNAIAALQADYPTRQLTEENARLFKDALLPKIEKAYEESQLGITPFDPSEVVENVADGFSDGDLDALFDTMRNTINDLSDRLTGAFNTVTGGNASSGDSGNSSTDQPEFGGSDATGDTAIFAVIGVAAVAGAALLLTKKKAK